MSTIILPLLLILLIIAIVISYRNAKSKLSFFAGLLYVLSLFVFAIALLFNSNEYNVAIDPIDGEGYSPFGHEHFLTLLVFYILSLIATFLLWKKNEKLPPLTWVITSAMVLIGIVINILILLQTSSNSNSLSLNYDPILDAPEIFTVSLFLFFPLITIIISSYLIINSANKVADNFASYSYTNPILNYLNTLLKNSKTYPVAIVVLVFPLFFIITCIVMLFGQDYDAMVKVFTDTTTWRFSQQMHPPPLDHEGHYLCTVAAKGDPAIVKPIRLGTRNGNTLIVNRQLQIANAFEEVIQKQFPSLHKTIRYTYDRYGYNLSTKINSAQGSNITYILMKPLEWVFLLFLYLFCEKPEAYIKKQYRYKTD